MAYGNALQCLSDPTQREVFERLRLGPKSVGELARGLPVSRPAVSQHLKVLKQVGLVNDRAVANQRLYSLDPRGLAGIRAYFDQFWNQALDAFKTAVEQTEEKP